MTGKAWPGVSQKETTNTVGGCGLLTKTEPTTPAGHHRQSAAPVINQTSAVDRPSTVLGQRSSAFGTLHHIRKFMLHSAEVE